MKILVVCQHFYPENFRINDICFELAKKGNDVTVLTGLPNYPKGKVSKEYKWGKNRNQIINGVKIRRCSLVGRGNSTKDDDKLYVVCHFWKYKSTINEKRL